VHLCARYVGANARPRTIERKMFLPPNVSSSTYLRRSNITLSVAESRFFFEVYREHHNDLFHCELIKHRKSLNFWLIHGDAIDNISFSLRKTSDVSRFNRAPVSLVELILQMRKSWTFGAGSHHRTIGCEFIKATCNQARKAVLNSEKLCSNDWLCVPIRGKREITIRNSDYVRKCETLHVTTRACHDCMLFLFFRKNKCTCLPVIHVMCWENERERKGDIYIYIYIYIYIHIYICIYVYISMYRMCENWHSVIP